MARKKGPQSEKAYQYLLDEILSFRILPGQSISDNQIATDLQMSRAPVREALLRLEPDGLVESTSTGFRCTEITISDLIEISRLRRVFESLAIDLIKERGGLAQSEKKILSEIFENMRNDVKVVQVDYQKKYHWDNMFHSTIVGFSKNGRLVRMFQQIQLQVSRIRWLNLLSPRHKESGQEHEGIYNALMRDDYELSIKLIKEHLTNTEKNFLKIVNSPEYRIVQVGTSILSQKQ